MPTYQVNAGKSSVEIRGKSSIHPIHATLRPDSVSGTIEACIADGEIDLAKDTTGHIEFPVEAMGFGNAMYDRELPKRLDTRTYPAVSFGLERIDAAASGCYRIGVAVAFHGVEKVIEGELRLEVPDENTLVATGEQKFDIRDFGVEPPKKLGMKVHPEFTIAMSVVAELNS